MSNTRDEMLARHSELLEMAQAIEDHRGRVGECDDCEHTRPTIVDPSTADTGEYAYCYGCIQKRINRLKTQMRKQA